MPGGKTRLGEKLVDERVNIYSDPLNPTFLQTPGTAMEDRRKITWIEKGL